MQIINTCSHTSYEEINLFSIYVSSLLSNKFNLFLSILLRLSSSSFHVTRPLDSQGGSRTGPLARDIWGADKDVNCKSQVGRGGDVLTIQMTSNRRHFQKTGLHPLTSLRAITHQPSTRRLNLTHIPTHSNVVGFIGIMLE